MDKKFKVSIEKQEDGSYIAYNTNMSGCTIIGTGDSVAAAKKIFGIDGRCGRGKT